MKIPRYILLLIAALVFALMVVCLMYVWFPEMISQQTFHRILMSFGVITLGSVVFSVLGHVLSASAAPDDKNP